MMSLTFESSLASWMVNEMFGVLNKNGIDLKQNPLDPKHVRETFLMYYDGLISKPSANKVLQILIDNIMERRKKLTEILDAFESKTAICI